MEEVTYQIHWLAFTVHAEREEAFNLYSILYESNFGKLQDLGHGGRNFKEIYHNILELKVYLSPSNSSMDSYWSYEIPGGACECINTDCFLALGSYLESNYKDRYKFTRIDFAFDHLGFEPKDVEIAIKADQVRSLAKRDSLKIFSSPFALRDNGVMGTDTVSFGSNSSERMITVYNKRGYTRLEFQAKDLRATVVAKHLLLEPDISDWSGIGLSHLRDFCDFKTDWWEKFVNGSHRAYETISRPREISVSKLARWLDKQVSPALSVAIDVFPQGVMDSIVKHGRKRRGSRYDLLLQASMEINDQNED
jgi:DNA relaxase NicK